MVTYDYCADATPRTKVVSCIRYSELSGPSVKVSAWRKKGAGLDRDQIRYQTCGEWSG